MQFIKLKILISTADSNYTFMNKLCEISQYLLSGAYVPPRIPPVTDSYLSGAYVPPCIPPVTDSYLSDAYVPPCIPLGSESYLSFETVQLEQ